MPEPLNDKKIAEFRQLICDAATRQFAENGVASVSMRGVAKALGYSATALYSYYTNKEEILAAAKAAAVARLAAKITDATQSTDDPLERLQGIARAYLQFAGDEPSAYELIMAPNSHHPDTYPELKSAVANLRKKLVDCFDQCVRNDRIQGDPGLLAQAFWAAIHGVVSLNMAGMLSLKQIPLGALFDQVVFMTTDGAAGQTPAPKSRTNQQFSLDF